MSEERRENSENDMNNYTLSDTKPKLPFCPDHIDGIFAMLFLVLGYFFLKWWVLLGSGLRMGIFTLLYVTVILTYMILKKRKPAKESWFWLAMLLGCALGYSLFGNGREDGSMWFFQMLFLLGMAVYWVLSANSVLAQGKTGNWMVYDLSRGFGLLPFGNFGCLFRAVFDWLRRLRQGKNLLAFLLGLALCLPVLGIVLPLLIGADKGFAELMERMFRELFEQLFTILLYGAFGIPVGCYLFGLVSGSIHKRRTEPDTVLIEHLPGKCRFLPMISVYTLFCIVGAVYVLFIGVQAGNLFSAFAGKMPEGYESYAEYAREGFFELCKVAAFNALILLAANVCSRRSCRESGFLRFCNVFLSVLTLLLLATAMSKMMLYVSVYGLSVRRLLPSWFMLFLGCCFVLIILLQWKRFSIIRVVAMLGSVMFVLLCLTDLHRITAAYNLSRWKDGTLPTYSVEDLYDTDFGGVKPAVKLYQTIEESDEKNELRQYLGNMLWRAAADNDAWPTATVQSLTLQPLLEETLNITVKEWS